jgi:hypothetical protein
MGMPSGQGAQQPETWRGERIRTVYVVLVACFTGVLAQSLASSFNGGGSSSQGVLRIVLAIVGMLVGLLTGYVGSVLMDCLLTLALRVFGLDWTIRQSSLAINRSIAPLGVAAAVCSLAVALMGAERGFESVVPGAVVIAAVAIHLGLVFQALPASLEGVPRRLGVVGVYLIVPLGLIAVMEAVR